MFFTHGLHFAPYYFAAVKDGEMNLERYAVLSDSMHEEYQFVSSGPKGLIRKAVFFEEMEPGLYNLAFGDWNKEKQKFDDNVRSNNGDRDKVLRTIAYTVTDFIKYHPGAQVHAEGATRAKTRLYQMGINANWSAISQLFEIKGFVDGQWELFNCYTNYDAFILEEK